MKQLSLPARVSAAFWFIVIPGLVLRIWLAIPLRSAVVMRDEAGYLANAAALAGYSFDGASSYHPGYSLFILPAYWLSSDPWTIYRIVQGINLLLAITGAFLLFRLLREVAPERSTHEAFIATIVGMSYPAFAVLSSVAMSENATVPLFIFVCYCCARTARYGGWYWFLWGLGAGLMFLVHPTAVATIFAGALVALWIAGVRREYSGFVVYLLLSLAGIVVYECFLREWLLDRLTPGEFPALLHYPSLAKTLVALFRPDGVADLATRLAGHALYLLIGSLGLAWLAVAHVISRIGPAVGQRKHFPETTAALLPVLSLLGTVLISALMFSSTRSMQLDHLMYGRYAEGVFAPTLAVGFLVAGTPEVRKYLLSGLLMGALLAVMLALSTRSSPDTINWLNISALWEGWFIRSRSPLIWGLMGAIAALPLLAWRYRIFQAGTIVATFLLATVLVHRNFMVPSYNLFGAKDHIARYVRSNYPAGTQCVGVDAAGQTGFFEFQAPFAKLGTQLFDHGLRRVTVEEWETDCDGPLVSWARDLDVRVPGVHLAAVEKSDGASVVGGPYLWARGPVAGFTMGIGEHVSFANGSSTKNFVLGNGWYAPEQDGTWSSARSELYIPLADDCVPGCSAEILFAPFIPSSGEHLDITVSVDGAVIDHWRLEGQDLQRRSIPLRFDPETRRSSRIELEIPGAKSPISLGLSIDSRRLGVFVQEISIVSR